MSTSKFEQGKADQAERAAKVHAAQADADASKAAEKKEHVELHGYAPAGKGHARCLTFVGPDDPERGLSAGTSYEVLAFGLNSATDITALVANDSGALAVVSGVGDAKRWQYGHAKASK